MVAAVGARSSARLSLATSSVIAFTSGVSSVMHAQPVYTRWMLAPHQLPDQSILNVPASGLAVAAVFFTTFLTGAMAIACDDTRVWTRATPNCRTDWRRAATVLRYATGCTDNRCNMQLRRHVGGCAKKRGHPSKQLILAVPMVRQHDHVAQSQCMHCTTRSNHKAGSTAAGVHTNSHQWFPDHQMLTTHKAIRGCYRLRGAIYVVTHLLMWGKVVLGSLLL